jgi:hypothetical protein
MDFWVAYDEKKTTPIYTPGSMIYVILLLKFHYHLRRNVEHGLKVFFYLTELIQIPSISFEVKCCK